MKKKLLILTMCLFSAMSANAATWLAVDTGDPNIQLFIDNDSIRYITTDKCTYALLYKKGDEPVKVIYTKSDYSTNKVGVIHVEDFDEADYNPAYYSKHTRAFLKNAEENGVLLPAHNYALSTHREKFAPAYTESLSTTPGVYASGPNFANETFKAYVDDVKNKILSNWTTSINTVYTDVNVMLSINPDGSLNGYRILESSADDRGKRAAVAAIKLSTPFKPFPDGALLDAAAIDIPIKFDQKFFKKYVK